MCPGLFTYITLTGMVMHTVSGNPRQLLCNVTRFPGNNVSQVRLSAGDNVTFLYNVSQGHSLSWLYSNLTANSSRHLRKYTLCSVTSNYRMTETRNNMCLHCNRSSLTLCSARPQDSGLYVLRDDTNNTDVMRCNVTVTGNGHLPVTHRPHSRPTVTRISSAHLSGITLGNQKHSPTTWNTWMVHISFATMALACFGVAVVLSGCVCLRSVRAWTQKYRPLNEDPAPQKIDFPDGTMKEHPHVTVIEPTKSADGTVVGLSAVSDDKPATLWLSR
ncbi:rh5 [macacine betaherpesvirus 3]|uniref:Rh5 n=1 Tax=Rhesus cytomegalovirus (strain 68-1) TaxID=47929 RepID=Q2FAW8_RHCM6|nr:rh5 [macacine betaherpesvirus 3]APT40269.1 Rh05 [macacine betaherpesvirus 3]QXV50376.1 membrane protein RL11A [macacine betaherpesvirus 3]